MRYLFFVLSFSCLGLASFLWGPTLLSSSDVYANPTVKVPALLKAKQSSSIAIREGHIDALYQKLQASAETLDRQALRFALYGYWQLLEQGKIPKPGILSIVDYSLPSNEKRFYVIDLKQRTLLHNSMVAHGQRTGERFATRFSNRHQSHQSSLGFGLTAETYHGMHGYSLRLDGLENKWNDEMRPRAVVIHGAEYVSQYFIDTYGRIGRSWGCPALPTDQSTEIIKTIKEGTCIYQHRTRDDYSRKSQLLNEQLATESFLRLNGFGS